VGALRVRVRTHPILQFPRDTPVTFTYDDKPVTAFKGESVAAALHAEGVKVLSHSLHFHRPRGFFCGIGKCSSCFMTVDGIPNVRTCITPVKDGMKVVQQESIGAVSKQPFPVLPAEQRSDEIAVIGCGPAGMMAALTAADQGARVLLLDENHTPGGQLIKQTHKFFGSKQEKAGTRGITIAEELLHQVQKHENITLYPATAAVGCYPMDDQYRLLTIRRQESLEQRVEIDCQRIVVACGAMENMLAFPGNDLPGVYGAGGVQTLMNVYGILPGKKVLMVGAGNVGLIVSYQLLQAGVEVIRVVEALPRIGGYQVHAAKLRRCGVPIHTSCSIGKAIGTDAVTGAEIIQLDNSFQQIENTRETLECDTICLAVGLTPSVRLLEQAGAKTMFVPEGGGMVAIHDETMQTTRPGVYVAGDSSGIEEASTAMIEGELAGVSAAVSLGYTDNATVIQKRCQQTLGVFRADPFGQAPRICKEKIGCCLEQGAW